MSRDFKNAVKYYVWRAADYVAKLPTFPMTDESVSLQIQLAYRRGFEESKEMMQSLAADLGHAQMVLLLSSVGSAKVDQSGERVDL